MSLIGSHHFLRSVHNSRQPNGEGRATAGLARYRDVAAHHLTKAPANHEAEASTAVFASRGCIGLGEFLEQFAHLLRRHADTGVADRDGHPVAATFLLLSCGDANGAAFGELVRVAHEVQQRLATVPAGIMKVKGTLIGPTHCDVQGSPNCTAATIPCLLGVYGYLGYPTAWMMFQLQNDNYARGAFAGELFSETTNWQLVASTIL
jgi:hypothetical protein